METGGVDQITSETAFLIADCFEKARLLLVIDCGNAERKLSLDKIFANEKSTV
jgi:hypothetical protein